MRYIIIIILISSALQTTAQIISSLQWSRDTIEIGEPVELYYSIKLSDINGITGIDYTVFDTLKAYVGLSSAVDGAEEESDIDWKPLIEKTKSIDKNKLSRTGDGYEYRDTLTANIWNPGVYVVSHPTINTNRTNLPQTRELAVTPLMVIIPQVTIQDTTQQILPILPIIEEPKNWQDYIWVIYILGALLMMALIYFIIQKKNKKPEPVLTTIIKKPAHVIALEKLEILRSQQQWKEGKIKAFQSELTYTIREYLENRFEINALESTTDEITRSLRQKDFSTDHESDLKEILQIADLIKFAKANPPEDIHMSFLDTAIKFVEDTKDINSKEEIIIMDEAGNIITNSESESHDE